MISIITPAFNAAPYITAAIESVLAQTYAEWELIIVNDGSTDATEEVIKQFTDQRIRYIHQENKGVSAARNAGLEVMKGDFFLFLDADDVLPRQSIAARMPCFDDPEVDFVDGVVEKYDHHMETVLSRKTHTFSGNPFEALVHLDERCFLGLTWLVRRKTTTNYYFDEGHTHGEDLLFYMRIAREGGIYTAVDEPVLQYRQHAASAMQNIEGLEKGYLHILHVLRSWGLKKELISAFQRKTCSIMVKCYLVRGQLLKALGAVIKFYKR